MTNLEWKKIYNRHVNGETVPQISKSDGVHVQSIYSAFKRLQLPIIRRHPDCGGEYNHNYFSKIDSEVKAYLLGWLLSDGYVSTRHRIGIKLQCRDVEILDLFISELAPGRRYIKDGNNSFKLEFTSKQMYDDLQKYNIVPNKTYANKSFPCIIPSLMNHTIRGYFDGDGSISFNKGRANIYICSINEDVLVYIKFLLFLSDVKSKIYREDRSKLGYKDMFKLWVGGNKDNKIKAFNVLYKDCNYKLSRKYKKWYDYVNTEVTKSNKK